MNEPCLKVHNLRGQNTEGEHNVHAMVMDVSGTVKHSYGDPDKVICPRSSLKFIQTLPLVETGAADAYALEAKEIALACASHNGEDMHTKTGMAWLDKLGLTQSDLECGGHWPMDKDSEHALVKDHKDYSNIHHNCSGKHLGALTTCLHMGWDTKGYTNPDHPLQQQVKATISALSETPIADIKTVTDGCSMPNYFLPLKNIVLMFARFLSGDTMSDKQQSAAIRIRESIAQNPFLIGGREALCTDVAKASNGTLIGKRGAMGNYVLLAPDAGLVLYTKCEDGNTIAAQAALCKLMKDCGLWTSDMDDVLAPYAQPLIKSAKGASVGHIAVL